MRWRASIDRITSRQFLIALLRPPGTTALWRKPDRIRMIGNPKLDAALRAERNWSIFSEWSADGWGPSLTVLGQRHKVQPSCILKICNRLREQCLDMLQRHGV